MKFFSAQWCAQAAEVANTLADFQHALADPAGFDLVVGLFCADAQEVASWVRFESGVVADLASRAGRDRARGGDPARPGGDLAMAADGEACFTDLLLGHKIKLSDTNNRVTYNYGAFDELLASWAHLPTDWEI